MVSVRSLVSVALLGLLDQACAQVENKNVLFPNGLDFNVNGLWNALPATRVVSHCNPYDMEVYEVTYSDCSDSWTFCRCNNSPWSLDDMMNLFGRIPVNARQHTRTFVSYGLLPQEGGSWAYAYGPDIAVFDSLSKGGLRPTLMLHENAHTVDYGLNWLSDDAPYVNAINNDQSVPDPYARSNRIENYAQVSVLGNYDLTSAGPLSRYADPGCLNDQLAWVEGQVRNKLIPAGSCGLYWPGEESVCMGPASGCGNPGQPTGFRTQPPNDTSLVAQEEHEQTPTAIVDFLAELVKEEEGAERLMRGKRFA